MTRAHRFRNFKLISSKNEFNHCTFFSAHGSSRAQLWVSRLRISWWVWILVRFGWTGPGFWFMNVCQLYQFGLWCGAPGWEERGLRQIWSQFKNLLKIWDHLGLVWIYRGFAFVVTDRLGFSDRAGPKIGPKPLPLAEKTQWLTPFFPNVKIHFFELISCKIVVG